MALLILLCQFSDTCYSLFPLRPYSATRSCQLQSNSRQHTKTKSLTDVYRNFPTLCSEPEFVKCLYLSNICTIFLQYVRNICPIFDQYLPNICTIFVQYLNIFCKIFTHYMQNILKIFAQNMYKLAQHLHNICIIFALYLNADFTTFIQYTHIILYDI